MESFLNRLLFKVVSVLPPSVIKKTSQVAMSNTPLLSPLARYATRKIRVKSGVIQHGPGKGLFIDLGSAGLPGQLLGTSELEEQNLLAKHLKSGDIFYDIGANIGFYVLIGARLQKQLLPADFALPFAV